jgi:hypothetical protein
MKNFATAAVLVMISASAHAGTYSYDGVTVHVTDGCRSSSCVSVNAPGYGSYNGGQAKARKPRKDPSRFVSAEKNDAPAAAAAPATDATPAKTQDAPLQAGASVATPTK